MTVESSAKRRIEELALFMSCSHVDALVGAVETFLAPPSPPLTEQQKARLERSLAESGAGRGIPHEEVMRRFGVHRDEKSNEETAARARAQLDAILDGITEERADELHRWLTETALRTAEPGPE